MKNRLIVINSYYIRIPSVNFSEGGKWILPFFYVGKLISSTMPRFMSVYVNEAQTEITKKKF